MDVGIAPGGLRERKKAATRERISAAAIDLFIRRGFDAVTVADVAAAAEVAPQTVFNYFPAKEDLVLWRLEAFEDALLERIAHRTEGESVAAAFRRELLQRKGLLDEVETGAGDRLVAISRMIAETPALQRREDRVFSSRVALLADLLHTEGIRGIVAPVVANALIGVHRALVAAARERILAGEPPTRIAATTRDEAVRALDLLEAGIATMRPASER
jgi:AcrR family transcriptional regulator